MNLNPFQLKMCDIQGRLFELSGKAGYSSANFIKFFMNSVVAACLDRPYNRMQWAGEEYLLEELADEAAGTLLKDDAVFHNETLYWAGYVYRYWAYLTGESSKQIYRQAPAATMNRNYLMFHTLDPEMAIEDLKTIYQQKKRRRSTK